MKVQQMAPAREAPAPATGSRLGFEQMGGNAFAQEQLMGAGAQGQDGKLAVLNDWVHQLWDARVDGTDTAWDAVDNGPDNWQLDLVESAIIGAILVGTSEITSPLVAMMSAFPALAAADRAILKKFLSTFVDAGVSPVVSGSIRGKVGEAKSSGEPSKDAYFHALKAGIRADTVSACAQWRDLGEQFADKPDFLDAMIQAVSMAVSDAEKFQEQVASINWMNLLAQFDTGVRSPENGADLGRAGSGRDGGDKLLNNITRGVIHVRLRFGNPEDDVVMEQCEVAGISSETLAIIKSIQGPLSSTGLPVFIGGLITETSSTIEIGMNDKGIPSLKTDEIGESWLTRYSIAHDCPGRGAQGGADGVMEKLASITMEELPVEMKWFQ